ncbi:MAG TPA: SRPBCC family protein [Jatrophihabitantaceae bacterium]
MQTVQRTGSVEVSTTATPAAVWAVLTDVTRVGEWSHESHDGQWLDGAAGPAVGARFRARNRSGRTRWTRTCEVTTSRADVDFGWRTLPTRRYRDSTSWRVDLMPSEAGTRIVQSFDVLQLSPIVAALYAAVVPGHRDRTDALRADLGRLAALAENA